MIQCQSIVKRVNGAHEWTHGHYQLLSAPYRLCLYKHRRQDERQPPEQLTCAHLCLDMAKSVYLCHGYSGGMSFPWALILDLYNIYIHVILSVWLHCCTIIIWYSSYELVVEYCPLITLTHWGRVTHICVSKLAAIIGSDNGLPPGRRQAITWTNAGILLIRTLGTNISEILCKHHVFSYKKMHLKMSSGKRRPFCLGLNVLKRYFTSLY